MLDDRPGRDRDEDGQREFNPAYNVQFATDTNSQVIVGVDVVTVGSDQGQMEPMVRQIMDRYGKRLRSTRSTAGSPSTRTSRR